MAETTTTPQVTLRRGDWIRFQVKPTRIVLEGFIQEIAADGAKLKVGKAPLSPEHAWHAMSDISILRHQPR